MTLGINEVFKINLNYEGNANASNFYWESSNPRILQVQNGEIFGSAAGKATVTVTGDDGVNRKISVTVEDKGYTLSMPTISFGVIQNSSDNLQKASGTVKVNAGQNFTLEIVADVWYYPVDKLNIEWTSTNEKIATVDQNGNVSTKDEKGTAIIRAVILDENGNKTLYSATVSLSVQEPFTVSSSSLTKYHGTGGNVVIPDDKNITTISSEAFKDNDNIVSIIIPKTVTTISERAFLNCTALKYVYFISEEKIEPADASINLIYKNAFSGCTNLEVVDFSNVKELTLDNYVFTGCTSLKEVKNMSCIGTMGRATFAGCTSLKSADLTGLHTAGVGVFAGCTSLDSVTTDYYTALGTSMFEGCTSLKEVTIKTPTIGSSAFAGCTSLEKVTFEDGTKHSVDAFVIGNEAFNGCTALTTVDFNGKNVAKIGDKAFANCTALKTITLPTTDIYLGERVFENTQVELGNEKDEHGAIYNGTKLLLAPTTITSSFAIKASTTEIAAYAFSNSTLAKGVKTIVIPDTVTTIGEGAFAYLNLSNIVLPASLAKINNYTFYHASDLTTITIPAAVKEIGDSVFDTCENLASVVFENGSQLTKMGNGVFYACTALTTITLPDGLKEMGDQTFTACTELVSANLPSVEKLGSRTFLQCLKLETVTFGANATTTGDYTFEITYEDVTSGEVRYYDTVLTNVILSDKIKVIGEGVFNYCTKLTSIDLKNVTKIGSYAFSGCSALVTVTGLNNLTDIGDYAFAECTGLKELNLDNAKTIGQYAFFIDRSEDTSSTAYTTVSMPKVVTIGDYAFAGGSMSQVTLPATLTKMGNGVFVTAPRFTSIEVDKDNKTFFTDSDVLYRNITDVTTGKTVYELVAYPTAKRGASYTILEGTVSVAHYAFAHLTASSLQEVTIPYSVKVLGVGAFYSSGITSYIFEAINAPTLLSEYYDNGTASFYSLYYNNFEDNFITHTEWSDQEDSTIKITYPSNGSGYTNYVYTYYFGSSEITAELINDTTRELKTLIESFETAETVATWSSLTVNTENTKKVSDFADSVKEAHRILNTITSETQRAFLGEENITKLTDIENALKAVKSKFNIAATATSLEVSSDSTHKTAYKVGEKFDMTGLKIIVTYDDYSTEVASLSELKLSSRYDDVELTTLNRYVVVEGYGTSVQVAITVTESGDDGNNGGDGNGDGNVVETGGGCTGCGSIDSGSGWATIGLLAVMAIAFFAVRLVKKSKSDDKGV
jgi:hypothetical protein